MSMSNVNLSREAPYAPPSPRAPIDLFLDANEALTSCVDVAGVASRLGSNASRRYPSASSLERAIADRWGVGASRVLVTAGGDEAIDRACRTFLGPGRELILPTPTFEMIGRYARLSGACVVTTEWRDGPYPTEQVLGLVNEQTAMIAVVSPNNPTGAVGTTRDLDLLAARAPAARLLVDLAYAEFADEDLAAAALAIPNAIVVRTFSKAFGMAGVRIGYAIGSEENIRAMRSVGSPYPVSGLSIAAAEEALQNAGGYLPPVVARIREERERLYSLFKDLGAEPQRSQGNFVLASFRDADWAWRALAGLGIGVRRFAGAAGLERSLRITCPGDPQAFERVCAGLRAAMRPQALLFDMDGVLADVSGSYRRAIALTADSFGVRLTKEEIGAAKAEVDSNNDWVVTHRLLARRGIATALGDVTARFESLYHGERGTPGLSASESLIPPRSLLETLAKRVPLGIVTGRPRRDCECFLERFGLRALFPAVVCMEDAPLKPDAAPVRLALSRLGVSDAWMIGDTPDDVVASRAGGVVPIGIEPPGETSGRVADALRLAGAARVLATLSELEKMLP